MQMQMHMHTPSTHTSPIAASQLWLFAIWPVTRFRLILFALTYSGRLLHVYHLSPSVCFWEGSGEIYEAETVSTPAHKKTTTWHISDAIGRSFSRSDTAAVEQFLCFLTAVYWLSTLLPVSLCFCTTWRSVLFVLLSLPQMFSDARN